MSAGLTAAWGVRGFIEAGGVYTAYQRGGPEGAPVVILLHGSPESADAVVGVAGALSDRFDVVGLDTPGNGLSEGLAPDAPESADYARHVLRVMEALGVRRAGVYGFHTGAGTAMSLALSAPERVAALALDGYAVWTAEERADLLAHYLVTFPPRLDGAHLASIWARLEAQLVFFPWYDARLAARMDLPDTPMSVRLRRLRDWLCAPETYVKPYAAAFRRVGEEGPDRVEVPTLIGASAPDPLSAHLDRLSDLSAAVTVERWGADRAEAFDAIARHFAAHPGDPAGEPLVASAPPPVFAEAPHDLPWSPDRHGGFLLEIWRSLAARVIAHADSEPALAAGLDPQALQSRLLTHVARHTGLIAD